jgi:3-dehydroquinate synthase
VTTGTVHVTVSAPPARTFDVFVRAGVLDELPARVAAAVPAARYAVIVPDDIARSHGARVVASLNDAGLDAALLEFPAGEVHKTRETWAALSDLMLELRCGRDSCVVAVGGGVCGDLAGFVAATYMRGVPVVQVPTTLLAMVDASVGGKTGVDTDAGKNLIGAFHAPALVLADPLVLRTLPRREFTAGLSEAVKHGAILDAAYFAWIEANVDAILSLDAAALEQLVLRSVQLKADVVMDDPYEHGRRAALNFGHTVAHALELHEDYALLHGHAVAIGMVVEAAAGEADGVTKPGTRSRIAALLERLDLPIGVEVAAPHRVLGAMSLDKKARRARPLFALPARIGEIARAADAGWTCALSEDALKRALSMVSGGASAV